LQALVAAAVIDGPLAVVTHQCFSRGSCVVTKQAKPSSSSSQPLPLSPQDFNAAFNSSSSSPSSSPLTAGDYITVTITTTSPPNQETIAHVHAVLPAAPYLQVLSSSSSSPSSPSSSQHV
jgi:hypothetical protein